MNLDVLKFGHVYSSAPWGGKMLRGYYGRADVPDICSESWEISGHRFGMSMVKGGEFDGYSLDELVRMLGEDLVGSKSPTLEKFPLLFKLIDARWPLSIQVHPNDRTAVLTGGEPKSEAWYIIKAFPGAALYAGLKHHFDERDLREIVDQGPILLDQLRPYEVSAGDMMYIPGGMPHAIGGGCFLYEVQQASDTTYRFYDWERKGDNGAKRPLHIEESFQSLDFSLQTPELNRTKTLETPYFTIREVDLVFPLALQTDGTTFIAGFVLEGETNLARRGESFLVPARSCGGMLMPRKNGTKLLLTTL